MPGTGGMVPYEEAVRRGLQFSEKEWMALSSGRQNAAISMHDNPPEPERRLAGPMTLLRYREIQRMLKPRQKKEPATAPQGYGFGDWHRALSDIAAEIDDAKFRGLEMTIGPKGARTNMKFSDLIEDEPGPGHPACTVMQEEWRAIITKALALVREPAASAPEVAVAERQADKATRDLEAANKRIEELEEQLAKQGQPMAVSV